MKRLMILAIAAALTSTAADAGRKDNFFNYKTKVVEGQTQMRGHFGKNWTAEEVKRDLAQDCNASGQTLAAFNLGDTHRKKGQAFVGVCG